MQAAFILHLAQASIAHLLSYVRGLHLYRELLLNLLALPQEAPHFSLSPLIKDPGIARNGHSVID